MPCQINPAVAPDAVYAFTPEPFKYNISGGAYGSSRICNKLFRESVFHG